MTDGTTEELDSGALRDAPEGALRVMWLGLVALAVGLVIANWP